MILYGRHISSVHNRVGGVVLPHQHLDGGGGLDILSVNIKGAVGCSEDMAVGYD